MSEQPIPVDTARALGEQYRKSRVVIVAYDGIAGTTNIVSWGLSPTDKMLAAGYADRVREQHNLANAVVYEDFRLKEAAEYKAEADRLQARIRELEAQLEGRR